MPDDPKPGSPRPGNSAPEARETLNPEQEDESSQAQTLAEEALGRATTGMGAGETEKVRSGDETDDVQDLVDHMKQMETSGRIDMSAYAGERNDDD